MSNSIIVSVRELPLTLGEVQQAFGQAFGEFGLVAPNVRVHQPENPPKALSKSILTVCGTEPNEHCWISFGEYPIELTGPDATTHMGSVTTRGSWLFASIVVLGMFAFGGTTAFNDSGELDGQAEYDATALRKVIEAALASGKHYMAR